MAHAGGSNRPSITCLVLAIACCVAPIAASQQPAASAGLRRLAADGARRRPRGSAGGIPQSIIDAYSPAAGSDGAVAGSAAVTLRPPPPQRRPPPSPRRPRPPARRPPPPPMRRPPPAAPTFGPAAYAQVLAKSFLFYESQRSGNISAGSRVPWRRSAHLADRVPGGYYDAGDYLKISYTTAHATLMLAWGALDFAGGMARGNQTLRARSAVKWGADYLAACHASPFQFVGLIGDMTIDHDYWGRPEEQRTSRPAWVWNRTTAASDLLGMASAALSSTSLLFSSSQPAYAAVLLGKARQLYAWGAAVPGQYSDSMPGYPQDLYESNRYHDKLMLAAAWLHRATGNASYLDAAHRHFQQTSFDNISPYTSYDSQFTMAATLLLGTAQRIGAARVPGYSQYGAFIDSTFLQYHVAANGTWGITRSPRGLVYPNWSTWGNNAYAANTAFVALLRAKQLAAASPNRVAAIALAKSQVDYALGSAGRSYVVGWGTNPPLRCHHAGASCPDRPAPCGWDQFDAPTPNPQVLHGALVGGPSGPGDAGYRDVRSDYESNEVAIDYNAGFTGALAGLLSLLP
ncbi:hypothetical protein CHLNCDRAFT_141891 [Chlorella variabilis]|uniref:Endoglucanase n=1 Tax=Chlorella variabilis TaxID=554065 RepID=E1Z7A0_CHLVA|nr:hypothetical protein CHLNCDRAFT_141891 [Chlorella variabilis]EFN58136.1 hypothetical protein CHLNCDRAFT_141891 [Chlorella variabilis]|eukprot:XP_005850238.1 hypothetical protein CHLNCDRAFT_141891 [Chlorella variabilis]